MGYQLSAKRILIFEGGVSELSAFREQQRGAHLVVDQYLFDADSKSGRLEWIIEPGDFKSHHGDQIPMVVLQRSAASVGVSSGDMPTRWKLPIPLTEGPGGILRLVRRISGS